MVFEILLSSLILISLIIELLAVVVAGQEPCRVGEGVEAK
jgi:hypothetical protein